MNRVVLLGTGCPSPSHIRYGPSTLISTEKQKILIDAGSGVTQRLSEFGLAPSEIDIILITHLTQTILLTYINFIFQGGTLEELSHLKLLDQRV